MLPGPAVDPAPDSELPSDRVFAAWLSHLTIEQVLTDLDPSPDSIASIWVHQARGRRIYNTADRHRLQEEWHVEH